MKKESSQAPRTAKRPPPPPALPRAPTSDEVRGEFNRAISFAIEQGVEAEIFLRLWREGDWQQIQVDSPTFFGEQK